MVHDEERPPEYPVISFADIEASYFAHLASGWMVDLGKGTAVHSL
jgi:hypothetical protein